MTAVSLDGKVAIVTGGGRGLGRAMALGFARAGAAGITVTSAASPEEIKAVASEIDDIAGGRRGLALQAEVADWRDCERVVAETIKKFGALHVLVNNAGKAGFAAGNERKPFWDATPEGWRRVSGPRGPGRACKRECYSTFPPFSWGSCKVARHRARSSASCAKASSQ